MDECRKRPSDAGPKQIGGFLHTLTNLFKIN